MVGAGGSWWVCSFGASWLVAVWVLGDGFVCVVTAVGLWWREMLLLLWLVAGVAPVNSARWWWWGR